MTKKEQIEGRAALLYEVFDVCTENLAIMDRLEIAEKLLSRLEDLIAEEGD